MSSRPKKKWGQNFLRNRGAVDQIVAAVEPQEGETIVEIGPGEGVLTEKLVELGAPVIAFEIDPELSGKLSRKFGEKLTLQNVDAVDATMPAAPYRAVGNLPYNVGTPILRRVIADPNCRRAVFMLQEEVVKRLVAKPGDEDYGYLTLYVAMFAKGRIIAKLGPKSFYPPPKVHSAVVVLDPLERPYKADRELLLDLISNSFRMRRKKLVNNLTGWRDLERATVLEVLKRAGVDPDVRAEVLGLDAFDRIALALTES
jgi:16S rRNA (adenine1518-N6/adenine1519-N6)-dimethyltransferase